VEAFAIPQIDTNQRIAVVFTSGSTGTPQPHPKTWGALVSSMQAEAARLGLLHNTPHTLIGTVPPQHMYGFESTVLMAWHSGNALSHAQPFYPADICQALAAVPTPRVLVSSPVHLRALLDAGLALPELALVVSATAPLSAHLAQDVEAGCHTPLMEIYGSTETGLIATRRPTQSEEWHLLPGIKLIADGASVRACGGHIETMIAMSDMLEPVSDEHFLLHGRMADLVNIAGKRHSLASLNHLLKYHPRRNRRCFLHAGRNRPWPHYAAGCFRGGAGAGGALSTRSVTQTYRPGFPAAAIIVCRGTATQLHRKTATRSIAGPVSGTCRHKNPHE